MQCRLNVRLLPRRHMSNSTNCKIKKARFRWPLFLIRMMAKHQKQLKITRQKKKEW
jgi:hypothetical protein